MSHEEEWPLAVATGDFQDRLRKKFQELLKNGKKKEVHAARDYYFALVEIWFGYLRTGSFAEKGDLKEPSAFLKDIVKEYRSHYPDKREWRRVKARMTGILVGFREKQ